MIVRVQKQRRCISARQTRPASRRFFIFLSLVYFNPTWHCTISRRKKKFLWLAAKREKKVAFTKVVGKNFSCSNNNNFEWMKASIRRGRRLVSTLSIVQLHIAKITYFLAEIPPLSCFCVCLKANAGCNKFLLVANEIKWPTTIYPNILSFCIKLAHLIS